MVANKFGSKDKDRIGKETRDKYLPAAGSEPALSAMVGGVSNRPGNPSEKKSGPRMAFRHGGMVKAGSPAVTAPCKDSKTITCR